MRYERLVPLAAGNLLEANIHNVAPGGEKDDPITHQGEAVGYLLEGEIDLLIDGTTYHMKAGDSFFFKAHLTNGYRNTGRPSPASSGSTRRKCTDRGHVHRRLLGAVAGDQASVEGPEHRALDAAAVDGERAPVLKQAALGSGSIGLFGSPGSAIRRPVSRRRRHQRPRIGVARRGEHRRRPGRVSATRPR